MKIRREMADAAKVADYAPHTLFMDPTEYADTLFGVGSATSAGPTLPSGSIHPSPETLEKDCGGYLREQPIVGFGQAYTSSSGGVKCYGNYLLSPMVGGVELDAAKRASFAVAGSEVGRCYEYRVTLENGIRAAVSEGAVQAACITAAFSLPGPVWQSCLQVPSAPALPQTVPSAK